MSAPGRFRGVSGTAILRHAGGAALVEFALIAPAFLLLIFGTFDLGQMVYGSVLLSGAVQEAARSSTLETADTTAADAMVKQMVSKVLPNAVITSTRTSYYDFSDIGRAERWNDSNANGTCDNGETYTDENGNGEWDPDIGVDGNGGANDTVVYKVTASYQLALTFPVMPEGWDTATLSATAVKKNQPFATQAQYGTSAGACS